MKINASNYSPPNVNYWGDRCCKAEAEIERLRAEVVTLAKLGDFEHVRPNTETYKLVARIRASGTYQQLIERGEK